jgi:hypothetical protein
MNMEKNEVVANDPEREYAERLGEVSKWLKENENDPHVESIRLDDLTVEDLDFFAKFKEGNLSEKELSDYNGKISEKFKESRKDGEFENSSIAFGGMLKNKLLSELAAERLRQLGIDPDKEK